MKNIYLALFVLLGFSQTAYAVEGNADAGQAKSAMCVGCHGADGNSLVTMYPKLAGQSANYIVKQLSDFKKGMTSAGKQGRVDPVMGGMSMALSEQDMADLAAFYSQQKISENKNATISELGKKLYQGGDAELGITACMACHGIEGKGMSTAGFPALASQNAEYIKAQMIKFRNGTRANDNNAIMRNIAIKLEDDAHIQALADYIASLKE